MTASTDTLYMRRAIALARRGILDTSPNPMVGCVIVADGRIIGEGYHRRCGEGHAEVNAMASVSPSDRHLLPRATVYVTLEPCSHYGKTPPCAKLLIDSGVRRVVVGCGDPNAKVNGRGVAMLRAAGIEVVEGVLEEECRAVNPKFMCAFSQGRPYVTLKWAQSIDGYMDVARTTEQPAFRFSSPLTSTLVHRLRATHDAILVGAGTVRMDAPSLTTRLWPGRSPRRFVASEQPIDGYEHVSGTVAEMLAAMRAQGVTSVLVEGGPTLLRAFLDSGLWDALQVEVAPVTLAPHGTAPAPKIDAKIDARGG